jgi:ricin-type beta-trefoil lectin protein
MSSQQGRLTESTPVRHWSNNTGNAVGGSRTAAEQALTMTAVGVAANLNGVHAVTANGKALDDPDWSKATGTQFVTWSPSGQQNQSWNFAQQTDGTYTISNGYSQLCDAEGGSTTAGTKVIQWTCTGRANQRWIVTATTSGYLIVNAHSGLPMTTASGADGSNLSRRTDPTRLVTPVSF